LRGSSGTSGKWIPVGGSATLTQADYRAVLGLRIEREEDADGNVVIRAASAEEQPQPAQH
jgi:hypothetical protein